MAEKLSDYLRKMELTNSIATQIWIKIPNFCDRPLRVKAEMLSIPAVVATQLLPVHSEYLAMHMHRK